MLKHELNITADPLVDNYKDYYGNEVVSFATPEPRFKLVIDSRMAEITAIVELTQNQELTRLLEAGVTLSYEDGHSKEDFTTTLTTPARIKEHRIRIENLWRCRNNSSNKTTNLSSLF